MSTGDDFGRRYYHWTAATGAVSAVARPCVLHTITINTPATTQGVFTIRDGLTVAGAVVAAITIGTFAANAGFIPAVLTFDVLLAAGLFIDIDATLAGCDITISYS